MATILVLWDIDHTLIETRGVGGQIYADAFRKATGQRLGEMPALSGRTEPVIFREALKIHDITDTGDLYRQFAAERHVATPSAWTSCAVMAAPCPGRSTRFASWPTGPTSSSPS